MEVKQVALTAIRWLAPIALVILAAYMISDMENVKAWAACKQFPQLLDAINHCRGSGSGYTLNCGIGQIECSVICNGLLINASDFNQEGFKWPAPT